MATMNNNNEAPKSSTMVDPYLSTYKSNVTVSMDNSIWIYLNTRAIFLSQSFFQYYVNKISLSSSYSCSFFVTIHFLRKNFTIWESQIVNLTKTQDCMGFLDGTIPSRYVTIVNYLYEPSQLFATNPDFYICKEHNV